MTELPGKKLLFSIDAGHQTSSGAAVTATVPISTTKLPAGQELRFSRGRNGDSTPPSPSARALVLCPAPEGRSPGQRFRFEQYLGVLGAAGIEVEVAPFLDADTSSILYAHGSSLSKMAGVLLGFFHRLRLASRFRDYDRIFVFREAAPLGPPIIEWLAFRSRKPVVYDFDDAIFIRNVSKANRVIGWLKFPSKVRYIARRSEVVMVCNDYLHNWTTEFNQNAMIVPTTVDLDYHRSLRDRNQSDGLPVIGWTGSHSTAPYLDLIRPALRELARRREFEFRVICDKDPGFPELKNYRFVPWCLQTEIADLDTFDIGVMPVPDGPWERGKVGFKAIQYGAMEVPAVVSDTGAGADVVNHGVTGMVVENSADAWFHALDRLLADRRLAAQMGREARLHVAQRYSTAAQAGAYVKVFRGLP